MVIFEGRVYPDSLAVPSGSELSKAAALPSLQRMGREALRRKMSVYGARFRSAAEARARRAGRMAQENRYLAGSFGMGGAGALGYAGSPETDVFERVVPWLRKGRRIDEMLAGSPAGEEPGNERGK